MWIVEVADYMGDGYWYDYPPFEFDTEEAARDFAEKSGKKEGNKVRRIYEKKA